MNWYRRMVIKTRVENAVVIVILAMVVFYFVYIR